MFACVFAAAQACIKLLLLLLSPRAAPKVLVVLPLFFVLWMFSLVAVFPFLFVLKRVVKPSDGLEPPSRLPTANR